MVLFAFVAWLANAFGAGQGNQLTKYLVQYLFRLCLMRFECVFIWHTLE